MSDPLSLYKLIILKLLSQINAPLTNSQISEFILNNEYTSYFTIQQVLAELEETGLVTMTSSHNSSIYRITDTGRDTLHYFEDKVSDAICRDIQEYLEENHLKIQDSLATTADYFPRNGQEYLVRCQVWEQDSTLIDLTLSVPSRKQALAICDHWKGKSQEIYAYVMEQLL